MELTADNKELVENHHLITINHAGLKAWKRIAKPRGNMQACRASLSNSVLTVCDTATL